MDYLKIVVFFISFGFLSSSDCQIDSLSYQILYEFFNSTSGNSWVLGPQDVPWKFPSPLTSPCSSPAWVGLTCENCSIVEIQLQSMNLQGYIPSSLGQLLSLKELKLYSNSLTSSIPSSLGQLSSLQLLYLYSNSLTSSIPSSLGQLSSLQLLYLYSNSLTNSIPSTLGQLSSLQVLDLFFNYLTSSIPSSLGQLSSLETLYLYSNSLTSSIPSSFGQLSNMKTLSLYSNSLTSSIPSSLGQLSSLQLLYLYSNSLTNSIPSTLGQLSSLQVLDLYLNCLTSSIPSSLGQLSYLHTLMLNFNRLTSSIPSSLGQLSSLQVIELFSNSLTNSIPSSLGQLSLLQILYLYSNSLTSSIPSSLGQLSSLQIMSVDNNYIEELSINKYSYNSLQVFSFSNNCVSSDELVKLCSLTNVEVLIFNELNQNCGKLFSFASGAEVGQFPSCIWMMEKLHTLMAIGNGLGGQIGDIMNSSALAFVGMDGNRISGSFPSIYKNKNISSLQLSFNKISGTLGPEFEMFNGLVNSNNVKNVSTSDTNVPLSFESNRLSGTLPIFIQRMTSYDVLLGNIFSCSRISNSNDINRNNYVCGSSTLDEVFLGCELFLVFIIFGLILSHTSGFLIENLTILLSQKVEISSVLFFPKLKPVVMFSLILIMLFLLIIYEILFSSNSNFSTHTFCYGWTMTIACFHGWWIAGILSLLVISFSVISFWWLIATWNKDSVNNSSVLDDNKIYPSQESVTGDIVDNLPSVLSLLALGLVGVSLVLVMSGVYVFTITQGKPQSLILLSSILLASVKLFLQDFFPSLSFFLSKVESKSLKFNYSLWINIVVVFIVPALTIFMVDSNCFLYSVSSTPVVSSFYRTYFTACISYITATGTVVDCKLLPTMSSVSIHVPFIYSYQCASSLIRNFTPVVLYSYILNIAVMMIKVYLFQLNIASKKNICKYPVLKTLFFHLNSDKSKFIVEMHQYKDSISRKLVVEFFRNVMFLLTYGIASPIIILFVVFSAMFEFLTLKIQLAMYLMESKNIDPILCIRKESDLLYSNHEFQLILQKYYHVIFAVVGLFWIIFMFDMIGDVSGIGSTLIFILCFEFFYCGILMVCNCWTQSRVFGQQHHNWILNKTFVNKITRDSNEGMELVVHHR